MGAIPGINGHLPNLAEVRVKYRKASAAITKGDAVVLNATASDGITVTASGADGIPYGIALETAAAAGDYIHVQTRGLGLVACTNTVTDGAAGTVLVTGANADVTSVAVASMSTAAKYAATILGYSLAAAAAGVQAAGSYMICPVLSGDI